MLKVSRSRAVHLGLIPNHDRAHPAAISVQNVSFWYGDKKALKDVSLEIYRNEVTAFIGPSGCGKTTLLRFLSRSNDIIPNISLEGRILFEGQDAADHKRPICWTSYGPRRPQRDQAMYGMSPIQLKTSKTMTSAATVSGRLRNCGPTHPTRPLKTRRASARIGNSSAPVTA